MRKNIFIFFLHAAYTTQTIPNSVLSIIKNGLNWYSLNKSYKQNEQSYNKKLINILKKTDYPAITKVCAYLIWDNYYVRKQFSDFYKLKDILSIGLFGKQKFEQQEKIVPLFYELLDLRKNIFENAHKQVYDDIYYDKEKKLRSEINSCKKNVPQLFIFKNEPSFKKANSSNEL